MSKYTIAFIDEEEDTRDSFENYFEQFSEEFHVSCILPSGKSVNDIVDEVVELNPDIVVIDYYLKYTDSTVPENGDVVMQRITDRKPLMPSILLTSFAEPAKISTIPPDKKRNIHNKREIADLKKLDFKNTVTEYVEYYRQLIAGYKQEFSELSLNSNLSEEEKGRKIELDNILESYLDQQEAVNKRDKSNEQFENLMSLIDSTQKLISDIKKKKNGE